MRTSAIFATVVCIVASTSRFALGATDSPRLSVTPIRLDVAQAGRAQTVSVVNGGSDAIDVSVGAYAWSQSAGVPLGLSETNELLVYPRLLHIEAHSERIVRVGVLDALSPTERAYRLSFTQVPGKPNDPANPPGTIAFRLRITMPVFVSASVHSAASQLAIEEAAATPHGISVRLRNSGPVHTTVPTVNVEALDAHGAHIAKSQVAGWYVLANAEQTFSVPIAAALCERIAHLDVEVKTQEGKTLSRSLVPASECAH